MTKSVPPFDIETEEDVEAWQRSLLAAALISEAESELELADWIASPLTSDEQRDLLAAFDDEGSGRWDVVAERLMFGTASPRFVRIVGELIRLGGFSGTSNLSRELMQREDRERLRVNVRRILAESYPDKTMKLIERQSSIVVAKLTNTEVRKAKEDKSISDNLRRGRGMGHLRRMIEHAITVDK